MLTILLVALALYIFWLLFRNDYAFAERVPNKKRNWALTNVKSKRMAGLLLRSLSAIQLSNYLLCHCVFCQFCRCGKRYIMVDSVRGRLLRHHQPLWQLLHSQYARCLGYIWVRRAGVFHH